MGTLHNVYDVNYSIDGGTNVTESLSGLNLATGSYYDFNHGSTWTPTAAGTYNIEIWATNINGTSDMNTANDMVSGLVAVYDNATIKDPCWSHLQVLHVAHVLLEM